MYPNPGYVSHQHYPVNHMSPPVGYPHFSNHQAQYQQPTMAAETGQSLFAGHSAYPIPTQDTSTNARKDAQALAYLQSAHRHLSKALGKVDTGKTFNSINMVNAATGLFHGKSGLVFGGNKKLGLFTNAVQHHEVSSATKLLQAAARDIQSAYALVPHLPPVRGASLQQGSLFTNVVFDNLLTNSSSRHKMKENMDAIRGIIADVEAAIRYLKR